MSRNHQFPARGLFVTGTDTEVGKTHIASMIAKTLVESGHRVGVYKPAASGGQIVDGRCVCDDAVRLWQAAGQPRDLKAVCPQMFVKPVAPHVAAAAEGKAIDPDLLVSGLASWANHCDLVVVEGAGGWLSPISDELYVADVAAAIGYPVVIVSANRLGTINQTLQTELAVRTSMGQDRIAGVILNEVTDDRATDASRQSNADEIRRRLTASLLAVTTWGQSAFHQDHDWPAIFGPR